MVMGKIVPETSIQYIRAQDSKCATLCKVGDSSSRHFDEICTKKVAGMQKYCYISTRVACYLPLFLPERGLDV